MGKKMKGKKCATRSCRNISTDYHKKCSTCRKREYNKKYPLLYTFHALRSNARRRGKDFNITLDEFKVWCAENGYMEGKGKTSNSFSIDRINDLEGYHINNMRILTLGDNVRKENVRRFADTEVSAECIDAPF
jgi:hypothetical protein